MCGRSNKLRQRNANNPGADKGPFRLFPAPADAVIPLCPAHNKQRVPN